MKTMIKDYTFFKEQVYEYVLFKCTVTRRQQNAYNVNEEYRKTRYSLWENLNWIFFCITINQTEIGKISDYFKTACPGKF